MKNPTSITPDECLWETVVLDEKNNITYSRPKMWGIYKAPKTKNKSSFHKFIMRVYLELTHII